MDQIKKHARLTGPAAAIFADAAQREYESGKTIRAIAEASGRSYGAVHRALQRAGVKFRSQGGHPRAGAGAS